MLSFEDRRGAQEDDLEIINDSEPVDEIRVQRLKKAATLVAAVGKSIFSTPLLPYRKVKGSSFLMRL